MIKEYQLLLENNLEKVTKDKQELLIRSAIMENMSKIDALTDMYNHRTFQDYLSFLHLFFSYLPPCLHGIKV